MLLLGSAYKNAYAVMLILLLQKCRPNTWKLVCEPGHLSFLTQFCIIVTGSTMTAPCTSFTTVLPNLFYKKNI